MIHYYTIGKTRDQSGYAVCGIHLGKTREQEWNT